MYYQRIRLFKVLENNKSVLQLTFLQPLDLHLGQVHSGYHVHLEGRVRHLLVVKVHAHNMRACLQRSKCCLEALGRLLGWQVGCLAIRGCSQDLARRIGRSLRAVSENPDWTLLAWGNG